MRTRFLLVLTLLFCFSDVTEARLFGGGGFFGRRAPLRGRFRQQSGGFFNPGSSNQAVSLFEDNNRTFNGSLKNFPNLVSRGNGNPLTVVGNVLVNLFERGTDLEERQISIDRLTDGKLTLRCTGGERVFRSGLCEENTVNHFIVFAGQQLANPNNPLDEASKAALVTVLRDLTGGSECAISGRCSFDFGFREGEDLEDAIGALSHMLNELAINLENPNLIEMAGAPFNARKEGFLRRNSEGRVVLDLNLFGRLPKAALAQLANIDPASKCLNGNIRFEGALKMMERKTYLRSIGLRAGQNLKDLGLGFILDPFAFKNNCFWVKGSMVAQNENNRETCFLPTEFANGIRVMWSRDFESPSDVPVNLEVDHKRAVPNGYEIFLVFPNGATTTLAADDKGALVTDVPVSIVKQHIVSSPASCGECHRADDPLKTIPPMPAGEKTIPGSGFFMSAGAKIHNDWPKIYEDTKLKIPNNLTNLDDPITGRPLNPQDFYADRETYLAHRHDLNVFIHNTRRAMGAYRPEAKGTSPVERAKTLLATEFKKWQKGMIPVRQLAESLGVTDAMVANLSLTPLDSAAFARRFCALRDALRPASSRVPGAQSGGVQHSGNPQGKGPAPP